MFFFHTCVSGLSVVVAANISICIFHAYHDFACGKRVAVTVVKTTDTSHRVSHRLVRICSAVLELKIYLGKSNTGGIIDVVACRIFIEVFAPHLTSGDARRCLAIRYARRELHGVYNDTFSRVNDSDL